MENALNYKPATAQLDEIMYPVELNPVFAETKNELFQIKTTHVSHRHLAIVNKSSNEIISVVSPKYKLLTNEDALKLGKQAFVRIFPAVKADDLIPFKVIAPLSLASCHIDLIHKDVKLSSVKYEQDTWLPFLRVSNSYNRTLAFTLQIGFVRSLCSNGVIFKKDTIEIKFNHDRLMVEDINFSADKLKKHELDFSAHLNNLRNIQVDFQYLFPMFCMALNLQFDISNKDEQVRQKAIRQIQKTNEIVIEIGAKYSRTLGSNAYAVLNTITDIVSHEKDYRVIKGFAINPNTYYSRSGEWMKLFNEESKKVNFKIENYLSDYLKYSVISNN
jgi:hypothetical protein